MGNILDILFLATKFLIHMENKKKHIDVTYR